ncbi:MAG: hypothetical protein EOP11_09495 [Proteobacteria bacterium]|nr:MAG: hypothetical protein EOP11_09495 [Pseudomonadota bacterium]
MIKSLLALALLALPSAAHATISCVGETDANPTMVRVDIQTAGTLGAVSAGRVTITPKAGPARVYEIAPREIPQFFESVDGTDQDRAVIGMSGFVNNDNPVYIRFVGPNTLDEVTKAIRDEKRMKRDEAMKKEGRNSLRVWKGPGYAADQQHSFKDVVCSVWMDN